MRAPEPLTRTELERLWRWEHDMVRFHVVAIVLLLLGAFAVFLYSDVPWLRRSVLALIALLVVAATALQLRERCPRCRARLRTKSMLRLPERCAICGVQFERKPPAGDAA